MSEEVGWVMPHGEDATFHLVPHGNRGNVIVPVVNTQGRHGWLDPLSGRIVDIGTIPKPFNVSTGPGKTRLAKALATVTAKAAAKEAQHRHFSIDEVANASTGIMGVVERAAKKVENHEAAPIDRREVSERLAEAVLSIRSDGASIAP